MSSESQKNRKKSGWRFPLAVAGVVLLLFFIGWGAPPMGVEDMLLPPDQ